jgi:hypothetical protein
MSVYPKILKKLYTGCWWLKPVILLAYEAEIRRTVGPGKSMQKCLQDPISTEKKLGVVVCICHRSDSRKHKSGGSQSRPAWAKRETLS